MRRLVSIGCSRAWRARLDQREVAGLRRPRGGDHETEQQDDGGQEHSRAYPEPLDARGQEEGADRGPTRLIAAATPTPEARISVGKISLG